MDKIAEIKEAEVRGVLAAFVDTNMLKVASEEDFDKLAEVVTAYLPDQYDVQAIADTTDALLSQAAKSEKTAVESETTAHMAALGELLTMKIAGKIDDQAFGENVSELLQKTAACGDNLPAVRGESIPAATKEPAKSGIGALLKNKKLRAAGLAVGALGAGGLAKYLVNKHRNQNK